jgi:hypothetical protein
MKKKTQAQTDTRAEHATAHRPSPWVVHHFPPGEIFIRDAQYGHNIATVAVLGVAMAEANARLIAAAPDMLVALRKLIPMAATQGTGMPQMERKAILAMARTAVAKAESRSPAR